MDGIKTKKLVENAEMDFAELMYQMYAEPGNSYGDISGTLPRTTSRFMTSP